jgi:uncharacterized protein YkwD
MRSRNTTSLIMLLMITIGMVANSSSVRTNATANRAALQPSIYLPLIIGAGVTPTPANDWLSYLNKLRGLANLPGVSENATYSDGDSKHAKYMVKNDVIAHNEDPSKPFYTAEGNAAANKSNVMVSGATQTTDSETLDMWMTGPFHGVGLIDPRLAQSGYGSYREADGGWQMGAALDVLRGLASLPAGVTFPIKWPADGKTSWLATYDGNESPDPLTACPGYTAPTGAPIYLQLGTGSITPNVTNATLTNNGASLPICVYTEATYTNPDSAQQSLGRSVLGSRDAIIMIPQAPLNPGGYTVSITTNGTTYTWSFNITNIIPSQAQATSESSTDTPPEP